ncbi:MAG: M20/M25/M40 family metallo-hydrolase [Acidobacteria bacterium]|nr:M20/M25/M40 family metallo-hydrolase [Acidobacteriota bacterium]
MFAPLLLAAASLQAQSFDAVLESIKADKAWTLAQQISICEIPAPPFKETKRGEEFARRLAQLGLTGIRTDSEGNVISRWPGSKRPKPLIIFSAHLDTVFPEGMDVRVKKKGDEYHGLGIGDDCRGLAVVLTVAKAFQQHKVALDGTVLFVGTVGEEGQGDLRGVRHLFNTEFKDQVDGFISVDGSGLRLTTRGVGSNRYLVTYKGPGGHSYGAFGMPNPAHALGRAVSRIADIEVPKNPKTTFNVGRMEGGTSVNSIPISMSMEIDMRSESALELAALDERIKAALQAALEAERKRWPQSKSAIELEIKTMGLRPASEPPDSTPIIQKALAAGKKAGVTIFATGAGSTDSNIPLSLGIPAITIGGGGNAQGGHSSDEWYQDTPDSYKAPQWAALILQSLTTQ